MRVSRCNGVEEEKTEERKKERALGLVGNEASLDDWLAGQCGVLDFAWLNQGTLRQTNSVKYFSLLNS